MKNIAATAGATSAASAALLTTVETQNRWSLGSFIAHLFNSNADALDIVITSTGVKTAVGGTIDGLSQAVGSNHPLFSLGREVGTGKSRPFVGTGVTPVVTSFDVLIDDSSVKDSLDSPLALLESLLMPVVPAFSAAALASRIESFYDNNPDGADYAFLLDQTNETFSIWPIAQLLVAAPIHDYTFEVDVVAPEVSTGWE